MIELLQFAPAMGLMNASPFCMKVEVFLRLTGRWHRGACSRGRRRVCRGDQTS